MKGYCIVRLSVLSLLLSCLANKSYTDDVPNTMYTLNKSTHKTQRKLAYSLVVVMCFLQVLINSVASAQMQSAHDNAGDNTLVICTGKGMVYINESLFLEAGTIEYVSVDAGKHSTSVDTGLDSEIVSSCTVAAQSDNPQYSFELEQAAELALVRSIDNFTLNQDNYLRDSYLCALSRAPPSLA